MTHYQLLGVPSDAQTDEIRAAFLREARSHHPDVAGAGSEAAMQRLNEAWAVLRDEDKRRADDRQLRDAAARLNYGNGGSKGARPQTPRSSSRRPNSGAAPRTQREPWQPHPAFEGDDDDAAWLDESDVGDPRTALGRFFQMLPSALFGAAIVFFFVGALTGARPILGFGLVLAALSVAFFWRHRW